MPKAKSRIFRVNGKVSAVVSADVVADSLEEALKKARELDVDRFVSFEGDALDYNLEIEGVSDPEAWA